MYPHRYVKPITETQKKTGKTRKTRNKHIINHLIINNMRKKLLLLAVSLLGMASAQAQTLSVADNAFEVLKGGSNTLTVNIGSATDVRDVQFNIVLPTGVTLGEVGSGNENYTAAISDATAVDGGSQYTVILYSASGAKVPTTVTFPISVADSYAGNLWDDLGSSLSAAKTTDDDATETDVAAADISEYTFEVGLLGDANKNGSVNIADVSTIISAVIGGNPSPYSALAANANETGGVNIADVSAVISIVTGSGSGE